ncbi:hypothetical protein D3C76_737000 [compost metagenome]
MVQPCLYGGAAGTYLCVGPDLRRVARDARLQPVHLPQRTRHQLPLLHPLHCLIRLVPGFGQWRGCRVFLAEQPLVGQCGNAVFHRLCRFLRLSVCPQFPADLRAQPIARPFVAGADGLWRGRCGVGREHQLRLGLAPGYTAGPAVYRGDFYRGCSGLVARPAGGPLFHHCLVSLSARWRGQYADGVGLLAQRIHHHVRQPDRFGTGGWPAVAGPG